MRGDDQADVGPLKELEGFLTALRQLIPLNGAPGTPAQLPELPGLRQHLVQIAKAAELHDEAEIFLAEIELDIMDAGLDSDWSVWDHRSTAGRRGGGGRGRRHQQLGLKQGIQQGFFGGNALNTFLVRVYQMISSNSTTYLPRSCRCASHSYLISSHLSAGLGRPSASRLTSGITLRATKPCSWTRFPRYTLCSCWAKPGGCHDMHFYPRPDPKEEEWEGRMRRGGMVGLTRTVPDEPWPRRRLSSSWESSTVPISSARLKGSGGGRMIGAEAATR